MTATSTYLSNFIFYKQLDTHIQLIQSSRDFDDVVANIIGVI